MENFRENTKAKISREKNVNILRKKYGREIINYDIIKPLMLIREFHKVFAINCCRHKTRYILHRFRMFSLNSFSRKNSKFYEKICKIRTKIFALFRESFRSLETLVGIKVYSFVHNKTFLRIS